MHSIFLNMTRQCDQNITKIKNSLCINKACKMQFMENNFLEHWKSKIQKPSILNINICYSYILEENKKKKKI